MFVSIHDVTPAFEQEVTKLWELCRSNRLTPALLVVPNWHGRWPLQDYPEYVQWLRDRARDGAEIILHGERHDEVGLPRTAGDSIRALGRTAREGEFLTLDLADATDRITRGLALLRDLGLDPIGFVPPAWLAREETHQAVALARLMFSEDAGAVRVHRTHSKLSAPALRWSGRTWSRAAASSIVASARWQLRGLTPRIRLALHPQDLAHPRTAASVEHEVRRWSNDRIQLRYAAL